MLRLRKPMLKLLYISYSKYYSTGVLSDIKAIADTIRLISPDTLIIVDDVCPFNSEKICFDLWNLDMVITGSQKFAGVQPGLSIVIVSQKAIEVSQNRKNPIASYYASWNKWLPGKQIVIFK